MDLVEAQNEILRLTEENKKIAILEKLKTDNEKAIADLQAHNQKLFLKLTHEEETTTEEDPPQDLVSFAHNIKNIK